MADASSFQQAGARTGPVGATGGNRVLYHYSALILVAQVLREGLSKGDIAHPNPYVLQQAVSLTSQTDPATLRCWGSDAYPERLAVRYACRVPAGDGRLEPARDTWRRLGVPRAYVRGLDPYGQSKWWFHYHGVIPPERLSVELRGRRGYVPVSGPDLDRVTAAAAAVWETVTVERCPYRPYLTYFCAGPDTDLGFFAEQYPAERFGLDRD